MQSSLLRTKLHRPSRAPAMISRERLLGRLHEGMRSRVTLVSAAAGSGKSTILSAWLDLFTLQPAAPDSPPAIKASWLTLDETDNQLTRFLRCLVAAILESYPDSCAGIAALLYENPDPSIEAVADALINDLALVPGRLVLVLDDLHQIDDAAIHVLLARLVQHAPPTLHLVLSTRMDPPLPLVRWRAQGWLNELRQQELFFTVEEAAAFLTRSLGSAPAPEIVVAVHKYTEGWPVGMRLAALALRGHGDPAAFLVDVAANSDRYVIDYLGENVLDQQPPEIQHFLMCTAILKRFNPTLCAAVLQIDEAVAQQQLSAVDRANLFLIDLNAPRRWVRYHHQFQSMLLSKLNERYDQQAIATLYRRAATWMGVHAELSEALGYLIAIGDFEPAADLIESRRVALLNRRHYQELAESLALMPPRLLHQRPLLLLASAWVQHWWLDRARAAATIDRLEQLLNDEATAMPESRQHLVRLEMTALRAGLDPAATDQGSLALIQATWARARPYLAQIHCTVVAILAERCQWLGAVESGLAILDDALEQTTDWPALARCHLLSERAKLLFWAINLVEAEQAAQVCLDLARRQDLPSITGPCRLILGVIAHVRNQWDLAATYLAGLVSDFHLENGRYAILAASALIEIYAFQGTPERARPYIERLRDYARSVNLRYMLDHVLALEAFLAMACGNQSAAMAWAITASHDSLVTNMTSESDRIPLACVRILLAEGSPSSLAAADRIVRELCSFHESRHHWYFTIEAQVFQALTWARLERTELALVVLDQAIQRAVPKGVWGLFTIRGQPIKELLQALRRQGGSPVLVDVVLAAFPVQIVGAPADDELSRLTDRELDVLRLMADGLSNKEIAQRLILSTNTVRNHAASIFDKLQVENRSQAVARGHALGLLPAAPRTTLMHKGQGSSG